MKQIKVNPNNEQFYSKEFVRGFNLGAQRQYEVDLADRPQGEWITATATPYNGIVKCSICGKVGTKFPFVTYKYCPNCGVDMRKESE